MKQTTFVADGQTKIFRFTFPFFLKSDVIIEVDAQPATNYNLICIKNGLDADIPFKGGEVHFTKPPRAASVIRIQRKLPLRRIVDYQLTTPYSPTAHNQDMNYVIEILKDMQDAVDFIKALPTDASNKTSIEQIKCQIMQIGVSIEELRTDLTQTKQSVNMTQIYSRLSDLEDAFTTLNGDITILSNKIENIDNVSLPDNLEYLVDFQEPTAANNYRWYRKYSTGRVEQGGVLSTTTSQNMEVQLLVTMRDTTYKYNDVLEHVNTYVDNQWKIRDCANVLVSKTVSSFSRHVPKEVDCIRWFISGMAAIQQEGANAPFFICSLLNI